MINADSPLLVGTSCTGIGPGLELLATLAPKLAPLARLVGMARAEAALRPIERLRQDDPLRLPDVRPVRAFRDRHGLPDELRQGNAQRTLRRRQA